MRPRPRLHRLLTVAGLTAALWARPAVAQPLPGDPSALVDLLNAPRPALRDAATRALFDLGRAGRPTVAAASLEDTPRGAAARGLLMDLPWDRPDDPTAVRALLNNYGSLNPPARAAAVGQLEELAALAGRPAVLRLLREDPSPAVEWAAAGNVTDALDSATAAELRGWAESAEVMRTLRPPALVAAAAAVDLKAGGIENDPEALALLRAALSRAGPGDDLSRLKPIILRLVREAESRKDYAAVLDLARRQLTLAGAAGYGPPVNADGSGQPPPPTDDPADEAGWLLLQVQAGYGPLPGVAADFADAEAHLAGGALPLYAAGRLFGRAGRPVLAAGFDLAGYAAGGLDSDGRFATGERLARAGWYGRARDELNTVLLLPNAGVSAANVRLRLFNVYLATRQYADAADALQACYDLTGGQGFSRTDAGGEAKPWPPDAVLAEVWRVRFLDAKARKSKPDMNAAVDHLLRLVKAAPDVAPDLVFALAEVGRAKEIGPVFGPAYAETKRELAANPTSPLRMNQLAWLLAQSDRKLDEALKLASEAVRLAPKNAGYLDTLAEVQFRRGAFDLAAALERRALAIDPGDAFMAEQLAKFEAAGKAAATRPTTRPAG